jgi:hypothetical protein
VDEISYLVGLDLGQASDFTALCILERTKPDPAGDRGFQADRQLEKLAAAGSIHLPPGYVPTYRRPQPSKENRYAVRHLERFELGTSYPDIVQRVVELFAEPTLAHQTLVVDQTGVGRAVVDLLVKARPKATIRPITITAGNADIPDGAGWHVPKKELVGVLQVLMQTRRLQVASRLRLARVLLKEFETFRVKITASANETFGSWRERDHDDLVLAVALAAWVGERRLLEIWIK